MNDYQVILGVVTIVIQLIGVTLYIRSVFLEGTKPHPFTWLVFATVDGTIFFAQFLNGGGPGAWLLAGTTCTGTIIFLVALWKGEKRITRSDWVFLTAALLGITAWITTGNALYAVILACFVEIAAKVPTFRKSYLRPHEESLTIWVTGTINFSLSVLALTTLSWTTAPFPIVIAVTNAALIVLILLRRRQLAIQAPSR